MQPEGPANFVIWSNLIGQEPCDVSIWITWFVKKGAEVKMKLQDLIKNTLKQKGIIHSKLHLYKNRKKKYPTSYHNLAI